MGVTVTAMATYCAAFLLCVLFFGPADALTTLSNCSDVAPAAAHGNSCPKIQKYGHCGLPYVRGYCCNSCFACVNCSAPSPPPQTPAPTPVPTPFVPPPSGSVQRLTVSGNKLLDPSGTPVRLTGFNWQIGRTGSDPGALMKQLAPNATVARLVGILWGNTNPLQTHPNKECMTQEPPNYFNDKCFDELDPWVKSATDAGLWVILAVRGEYVAGQNFDSDAGSVVFRNETLRSMAYAMWRHVAAHYASFDRIAAYEILSEPRDKTVEPSAVREFYQGGCAATQQVDPQTPCMVGNAPYYKLWNFGDETVLLNSSNVIYTFDYFNPDQFVFGTPDSKSAPAIPKYGTGSSYECSTLYKGWSQVCQHWGGAKASIPFDKQWHTHNLQMYAETLKQFPLFMNQFEVVHGVSAEAGRYEYIGDLLAVAKELDIGWAWWTWAGGNSDGWSHGSAEVVFRFPNGTIMIDTPVLDAMGPYF